MKISVIIPTWNESARIGKLVRYLLTHGGKNLLEVIVVDGGSDDDTPELALNEGARVYMSAKCNRALQMNLGVRRAQGNILYFLHADALPPKTFVSDIMIYAHQGNHLGCYRLRFNSSLYFLKLNGWCTRFNGFLSGGGDQSLFIHKDIFNSLGGFDESREILEDFHFVRKAKKNYRFCVMSGEIVVSARKYTNNSYLRVNISNLTIVVLDRLGVSSGTLAKMYRKMLRPSELHSDMMKKKNKIEITNAA